MSKKIISAVFAFTCAVLSANASAQTYAGITVGKSSFNIDCDGAPTCDKSPTAFRLLGGYDLSPNVALEAGYFSVGTAKFGDTTGKLEIKGTGIDFSAVFKTLPASGFVGFAKLGLGFVKAETSVIGFGVPGFGTVSGSISKNSAQPVIGLGALYEVSSNLSLRAEIESRQLKLFDDNKGKFRAANFSVGVQMAF